MPFRIDRIDFTEATHCALCATGKRALTTGIAYIVVDEHGKEHAAGPSCAKRKTTNGKVKPPDFTRGSLDLPEEVDQSKGRAVPKGALGRGHHPDRQLDQDKAVEYVRLRAVKLADIPQVQHSSITHYYELWRSSPNHRLDDDSVSRIIAIISDIPKKCPYLDMKRLQTVYAFDFWLARFLAVDDRPFMRGIREHLRKYLRLTPKQIETANTILTNETAGIQVRLQRLDPEAFIQK